MSPSESILAAMKAELARQTEIHGIKFEAMSCTVIEGSDGSVSIHACGECAIHTSAEAAASVVAKKVGAPSALALAKRERAAKLIAEADALCGA